jgi:DNA-dependent RNA polymerase auxiliary subunit epsilon
MTQQEIQERNKQIALMLGWKYSFAHKVDQYGYYQTVDGYSTPYMNVLDEQAVEYQSDKNAFAIEDLQFHSDWNWLMEAVEFIQKELIKNNDEFCIEFYEGLPGEPMTFVSYAEQNVKSKSSKESVFIAVSDFAKLYNNKEL